MSNLKISTATKKPSLTNLPVFYFVVSPSHGANSIQIQLIGEIGPASRSLGGSRSYRKIQTRRIKDCKFGK